MCTRSTPSLSELEVLVVDCQATASAPRGHLLEIGWARVGATVTPIRTCLIRLPDGTRVPPGVTRITGISDRMAQTGVDAASAWRTLTDEALKSGQQPAPTIIHFARFEQPFLGALAGGVLPLDVVCTHQVARRLLPDLPRCSLRALAGYFGHAVGVLRRSASHVEATVFVWRQLTRLLDAEGVSTWGTLRDWLAAPVGSSKRGRRVWPMPRDLRLSLPDAPGVYRLLRTNGDVLYVGKASSLRHRVNSHFRKRSGMPERTLEMLSQVRAISFEVAASALEAALVEPDEIKRVRPPYNVALTVEDRAVWFSTPDLRRRSPRPTIRCRLGPFASGEELDRIAALARADRAALARGRWGPDTDVFEAGYARLRAAHRELSRVDLSAHARLLRLGRRLWREGLRVRNADGEGPAHTATQVAAWTPEQVQAALEWLAVRAVLAWRRARWLTRLVDVALVWSEPGTEGARLMIIEAGEIVVRASVERGLPPPVPPGHRRPVATRREAFTLARFDRLRVLSTGLKRLVSEDAPVSLRFGVAPPLAGARLAGMLSRV
jgi:DNA polymerase-3 subunit epsilon